MKYQHCVAKNGDALLQVWGQLPRFIMAEANGEGDLAGLGKTTRAKPVSVGPWLSRRLPSWASPVSRVEQSKEKP